MPLQWNSIEFVAAAAEAEALNHLHAALRAIGIHPIGAHKIVEIDIIQLLASGFNRPADLFDARDTPHLSFHIPEAAGKHAREYSGSISGQKFRDGIQFAIVDALDYGSRDFHVPDGGEPANIAQDGIHAFDADIVPVEIRC